MCVYVCVCVFACAYMYIYSLSLKIQLIASRERRREKRGRKAERGLRYLSFSRCSLSLRVRPYSFSSLSMFFSHVSLFLSLALSLKPSSLISLNFVWALFSNTHTYIFSQKDTQPSLLPSCAQASRQGEGGSCLQRWSRQFQTLRVVMGMMRMKMGFL